MTSSSNRIAAATADTAEPRAPALDLSVTKVAGGALAAVTTAVAASFFGVTGTLTGAAFGSVVSSVAAALYAASFKTAHTRIRATRTLVTRSGRRAGGRDPEDPAGLPPELTGRSVRLPGESVVLPASDDPDAPGGGAGPPLRRPRRADRERETRGRPTAWKPVAVLAGFVFVVALGAISVTELFLGHPISDSKNTGTSIGTAVRGGGSSSADKDDEPAEDETDKEATPSDSSSQSASTDDESPSDSQAPSGGSAESGDEPSDGQDRPDRQDGSDRPDRSDRPGASPSEPAAPTQAPPADVAPTAGAPTAGAAVAESPQG